MEAGWEGEEEDLGNVMVALEVAEVRVVAEHGYDEVGQEGFGAGELGVGLVWHIFRGEQSGRKVFRSRHTLWVVDEGAVDVKLDLVFVFVDRKRVP